jgi:phage shock protein PspC (stress-responsive transcriptional regulator)
MKRSKNGLFAGVCAGIGKWLGIGGAVGEIIGIFLLFVGKLNHLHPLAWL